MSKQTPFRGVIVSVCTPDIKNTQETSPRYHRAVFLEENLNFTKPNVIKQVKKKRSHFTLNCFM